MPAPSPSTNPSRSASNGREARSGSSLRCESVRACTNPATVMPVMQASAPPAITTSASPAAQQPHRPGQRLGPGRARRHRRVHARPCLELQADPRGGPVGHEHRDGERGDLAQAGALQQVVLVEQGDRAADAGADHDGEPLRVDHLAGLAEAGVRPRLLGGDERHLLAAVQPPRLHARDHLERRHRQRGGDAHRQVEAAHPLVLVVVDAPDAGAPREHRLPGGRDVPAERGGGAEAGDDDRFLAGGR